MKIWNKIKSYALWIGAGILATLVLVLSIGKLFTKHTKKTIQKKIDANNKKIQHVTATETIVKEQKRQVKKELIDLKETVKKTKTSNRKPSSKKKTTQSKKNIVSKTTRKK